MANVLHIIDARTPPDMLGQLALLAGAGDRIVSIGPAPRAARLPLPVTAAHRPMGAAHLAGWRICRLSEGAEIIHAWSPDALQAGKEVAISSGKPLVASLPFAPEGKQAEAIRRAVGPGLLAVTVPTESARQALIARGLPAGAVHVLPPAAEGIDGRDAIRRRVRGQLGTGDEPIVAAPDVMVRGAGHHLASWAHAIVRQVLPGRICLLLPGGGPIEQHVRFFAGTTGYDPDVFLTRDRFDRPEVLAASDVAVFFHERSVGIAALAAAMAAGLPIAASRTPDAGEAAPHEEAALLVAPGDPREAAAAVLRLLEDSELAGRLAAGAQHRAAELFSPRASRKQLETIHAAAGETRVL